MKISKNLEAAIIQMIDELNASLPEDSEPQTSDGWIAGILKSALADYYSGKTRAEKEGELSIAKKVARDKEWEIQNLIVANRKEVFEL